MTQAFQVWYFCVGGDDGLGGMDIFGGFVELSFPPLYNGMVWIGRITVQSTYVFKLIVLKHSFINYKKKKKHIKNSKRRKLLKQKRDVER